MGYYWTTWFTVLIFYLYGKWTPWFYLGVSSEPLLSRLKSPCFWNCRFWPTKCCRFILFGWRFWVWRKGILRVCDSRYYYIRLNDDLTFWILTRFTWSIWVSRLSSIESLRGMVWEFFLSTSAMLFGCFVYLFDMWWCCLSLLLTLEGKH